MKLAYLIMAHQQPDQLRRLVRALDCESTAFFVHIDAQSALQPFQDAIAQQPNIHFLQDRVTIRWMGFSLVEATLRLLQAAMRDGFDYCVLLSGADYPIKSNAQLVSFYENAKEEYIAFWQLADRPSWMHKVLYYYPTDLIPIRPWSTNTDTVYWRRLFWGRFFQYRRYMPKRKFIEGMVPYGGPDWWSLSYGCVQYILRFVADNPGYKRFYRFTASPGEMFFQTIILNSGFAKRVHNHESYLNWSAQRLASGATADGEMLPDDSFNFRYVDWSGEVTKERETPAILDERDWNQLAASDSHFARKLDPSRSSRLLDRIDRDLLGLVPQPAGALHEPS